VREIASTVSCQRLGASVTPVDINRGRWTLERSEALRLGHRVRRGTRGCGKAARPKCSAWVDPIPQVIGGFP
jgi:hypothetical protein